jgi:integrase
MKARLTINLIDNLKPTSKRQIVHDLEVPGLALFITAKFINNKGEASGGHKSFYYIHSLGQGSKRQLHLGAYPALSLQGAREKVRELMDRLAKGGASLFNSKLTINENLTVDDCLDKFFDGYVNVYLKKLTTKAYYSFRKNYISPVLGSRKIYSIGYQDLAQLHFDLKAKPATANRVLAVCSKFLNWCEKEGYRARGSETARGIERYQEKPVLRFLSVHQLREIWEAINRLEKNNLINARPAAALRLLILTGARKNEILDLKWSEIEFDRSRAVLSDSKTGFKILYFPRQALEILYDLPRQGPYLFPSNSASGRLADLQWQWGLVLKEAKLEGRWRIHDLRHGFASAAVNAGGSLPFIGFLLGHKRARTTERYAHVAENPAQALLNQVADSIAPGRSKDK